MIDPQARGHRRFVATMAIGSAAMLAATGCWRPGSRPRTTTTTVKPSTTVTTPAPTTTMPGGMDHGHGGGGDGGHGHGGGVDTGGMGHIPARLNHPPTAEQKVAAQKLIDDAKAAAVRNGWTDVKKAEADGYHSIGDDMTGVAHYANLPNHVDGKNFDPDHVEVLVYKVDRATGAKSLQTFMYVMERDLTMDTVPDIAGNLVVYHAHDNLCYTTPTSGKLAGIAINGKCTPGGVLVPSQPMVHVWIVDNPCGPFAGVDPGNRTGSCSHDM